MAFRWTCPFCNYPQAVTDNFFWFRHLHVEVPPHKKGNLGITTQAIVCANVDCMELSLTIWVAPAKQGLPGNQGPWQQDRTKPVVIRRSLLPEGSAKTQPDYIPIAIREDYTEACLIGDLSPKASATLARRCLQGMLRDFCCVKPGRLIDEIKQLETALGNGTAPKGVSVDSIEALTAIRQIGNFGAHMEKDVDLVVPVDSDEARELIELIEMLLEDWYVERHKRAQRFDRVVGIAAAKRQLASDLKSAEAHGGGVTSSPNPVSDAN